MDNITEIFNENLWVAPAPNISILLAIFIINLLASGLISLLLVLLNPQRLFSKRKALIFLLLTSLGAFIPIVGILLSIVGVFCLRAYNKNSSVIEINTIPAISYTNDKIPLTTAYGEGWARVRLNSSSFSKKERENALISISKNISSETNTITRKLLSDDVDELRLYAFNLLENQQNNLNKCINELLQKLQTLTCEKEIALTEKNLALLYFELAYLNLNENELRQIVLQKSYQFATKAVKVLSEDAALFILLARLQIEREEKQEAIKILIQADQLRASPSKTYPYFAEYYFNLRDFAKVKKYLSAESFFRDIPKLHNIVKFWCPP